MLSVIVPSMLMILLSTLNAIRSNHTGAIDVKMDGSVPEENKMLGLNLSSKLDWDSYIIFIAKFLSLEVALYLYKFTIQPCMGYCCHVWAGAPSS